MRARNNILCQIIKTICILSSARIYFIDTCIIIIIIIITRRRRIIQIELRRAIWLKNEVFIKIILQLHVLHAQIKLQYRARNFTLRIL